MDCIYTSNTTKDLRNKKVWEISDYISVPEDFYAEQLQRKEVYDWDRNMLILRDKYNYNLRLRGKRNIVTGKSGIGKSFMCQLIKQIQSQSGIGDTWTADNIVILDQYNKELLREDNHKLIIVDNAELIILGKEAQWLNSVYGYNSNRYLFISNESLDLDITPSYYCEMIRTANNTRELFYQFQEWFNAGERFDGTGWYEKIN